MSQLSLKHHFITCFISILIKKMAAKKHPIADCTVTLKAWGKSARSRAPLYQRFFENLGQNLCKQPILSPANTSFIDFTSISNPRKPPQYNITYLYILGLDAPNKTILVSKDLFLFALSRKFHPRTYRKFMLESA